MDARDPELAVKAVVLEHLAGRPAAAPAEAPGPPAPRRVPADRPADDRDPRHGDRRHDEIFALTDTADPASWWQPDEGLDGLVPRAVDDTVVRGYLYPNFLRPLAVLDGSVAHAAGFFGPRADLPVHLAALTRAFVDRCTGFDPTLDLPTRCPASS